MAIELVPCPACDKPLSPKAVSCPNCGHPLLAARDDERFSMQIENELARQFATEIGPLARSGDKPSFFLSFSWPALAKISLLVLCFVAIFLAAAAAPRLLIIWWQHGAISSRTREIAKSDGVPTPPSKPVQEMSAPGIDAADPEPTRPAVPPRKVSTTKIEPSAPGQTPVARQEKSDANPPSTKASSTAGWQWARWGMTIDDVLSASPQALRTATPTEVADLKFSDGSATPGLTGPYQTEDYRFRAWFYFDKAGKLSCVRLNLLDAGRSNALYHELLSTHGPGRDNGAGLIFSREWFEENYISYTGSIGDIVPSVVYCSRKSPSDL